MSRISSPRRRRQVEKGAIKAAIDTAVHQAFEASFAVCANVNPQGSVNSFKRLFCDYLEQVAKSRRM